MLILKFISLLVGAKSPRYVCVLHIVSNFVFTMLLILAIKLQKLGFMDLCDTDL